MAVPQTISQITDLGIGASGVNILDGLSAATLDEMSVVQVFASRESVDVTLQIVVGDVEVMRLGPCAVDATVGNPPVTPNNLIYQGLGKPTQKIAINGTNVNAAAQELKCIVKIVSVNDAAVMPALIAIG
jgi:hypothetical protein